jgi:hypothetical protein
MTDTEKCAYVQKLTEDLKSFLAERGYRTTGGFIRISEHDKRYRMLRSLSVCIRLPFSGLYGVFGGDPKPGLCRSFRSDRTVSRCDEHVR